MKIYLCLLWIGFSAFGAKTKFRDDQIIRDLFNDHWEAWNKKEAKGILNSFSEDCSYLNQLGKLAVGKSDIERYLSESIPKDYKNIQIKADNSDIKFISRNVALYDQDVELVDTKNTDEDIEPQRQHLNSVLLKKNGKWWIVAYRIYSFNRNH